MPFGPYEAFELVNAAMLFALGLVVYFTAPGRLANRLLGPVLVIECFAHLGVALDGLLASPGSARGAIAVHQVAVLGLPFVYLAFLSTVETPLVRWLRPPPVRAVLLVAAASAGAGRMVWPDAFWAPTPGPTGPMLAAYVAFGAACLFGLAVAVSAWRRAKAGTLAKDRARAYMLAFGARDVFFGSWLVGVLALMVLRGGDIDAAFDNAAYRVLDWFPLLATLTFAPTLTYGVLKTQLFDIDLKVKWTISRGTVAAAFVAVFFVVSEGAQELFSARVGPWVGLLACGLLVFALAPLQRAAERLSRAAVPDATPTPDYIAFRKLEVYRAAVESAFEDGGISDKERRTLKRLSVKLGIDARDAVAVESDVSERLVGSAAA